MVDGRLWELTTGMTVSDLRFPNPEERRASTAVELDRERFRGLAVDTHERIGEANDEPSPAAHSPHSTCIPGSAPGYWDSWRPRN